MMQLSFYVPETHLESVKSALFEVGAGRIGQYDSCCWQTRGTGQFRASAGAKPFLGDAGGEVERVDEFKVEMVFESHLKAHVIAALKSSHPYEEPAYTIVESLIS